MMLKHLLFALCVTKDKKYLAGCVSLSALKHISGDLV